jgi:zona occludens toxin
MAMADEMCRQIVEKGFFVDFKLPVKDSPARASIMAAQDKPASVLPQVVAQPPVQLVQQQPMSPQSSEGYTQGLAARNAQVRSVFQ